MRLSSTHSIVFALLVVPSASFAQSTTRASVDSHGLPGETASFGATISADGRYVAFSSASSELVPGDTNGVSDVFVHDRITGTTVRASVSSSGTQADADCIGQFLSADGRFVAFRSAATTLVSGDTNGVADVFVRDLVNNTTERVSVASGGGQSDGDSYYGALSADGRFVSFTSSATNLVANDNNFAADAFVHDRLSGVTERVSVDSSGIESGRFDYSISGTISGDGRYVTFESVASSLVAGDTNSEPDVFLRDRLNGTTTRISLDSNGAQADGGSENSCISADGRYVAFTSDADNLVVGDTNGEDDVFVRDLVLGTTTRASVGPFGEANDESYTYYAHTTISEGGRFVVFQSEATNLTAAADLNNTDDIFVRDMVLGTTSRVSVDSVGNASNGSSIRAAISGTGRFIAFEGESSNLVAGDVNGARDVFVRDVRSMCLPIEAYCTGKANSHGCVPAISASGEPSATGASAFALTAVNETLGSTGVFVWSHNSASTAFGGGTLCLQSPLMRTMVQSASSHASTAPSGACIGAFTIDFGAAYMQAHALVPGMTIYGQFIGRDAGFAAPNNVSLSDAIHFTICP